MEDSDSRPEVAPPRESGFSLLALSLYTVKIYHRLGSLEDSIPEWERPAFGFVHKISSPEHVPQSLLDFSADSLAAERQDCGTPAAARATYSISAGSTPVVACEAAACEDKRASGDSGSSGECSGRKLYLNFISFC